MLKTIFAIQPWWSVSCFFMFHAEQVEEEQRARERVNTQRVIHDLDLDIAGHHAEACYLYKGMIRDGVPIEPSIGATFEKDCARAGT